MVWTSQDKGLAPGAVLLSGAVEALDGGARMPTTEPFTMGLIGFALHFWCVSRSTELAMDLDDVFASIRGQAYNACYDKCQGSF